MTVFTQKSRAGEFLLSECDGTLSRDSVVIASGAGVLVSGTVLGKVTASGKMVAYKDGASDGSQAAVGVLLGQVDATSADQQAVAITRIAEVSMAKLVWDASNDATAQAHGIADLAALNIIARS